MIDIREIQYSRRFATRPPARMVMVPGFRWAYVTDPIFTTLRNFGNLQKPWKNTIYDTILGLSWAFVQRIFTYVGSMLALYNAMSGPPGVHRTLCQDHVRPMLDPKYALKSVSNKTCVFDTDFDRPEKCPMTPCRGYLKLRWRYIGPLLCLCWAPHDAMLAPCWAHVTLMLTQFPHLTKVCRSSKTMEKHSILEQKRGPPPPQIPIWNSIGPLLGLSWASLGPLFNVYLPMLGPCWPYITPCRSHLGSIGRYVRTMLGLCWTQNTP